MRKLLLLPFIFLLYSCNMTQVVHESVEQSIIVELPNKSHAESYVAANNWMISIFFNAESIIQFTDKESGTISGRYQIGQVYAGQAGNLPQFVYAILKVEIKDEKVRLTIIPESFRYVSNNPYSLYSPEQLNTDIQDLFQSFEDYMLKPTDSDW